MPDCTHCGTPFSAGHAEEAFCCKGCEFVHELIHVEGLDRFYDLRRDSPLRPARGLPFEPRDFSWLKDSISQTEGEASPGDTVEGAYSLDGISCVGCVWLVEKVFLRHDGAVSASAHPATGRVNLQWIAGRMDLSAFAADIASFGYILGPPGASNLRREAVSLGSRTGLCGAFAMNAMAFTLPFYLGMPEDFAFARVFQLVVFLSATLSMLVGGTYFIQRAWKAIRMGALHIDLPIALGLIIAYLGSIGGWILGESGLLYFDFVGTFVFLMLGGRYLQMSAVEKNRSRLQRHRPVPDMVRSPDHAESIPLSALVPATRFELQPGQSVPVASVMDSHAGDFSLEWISGEADSRTFHAGRAVPAGAIHLGSEPVILTASETWGESLLSRLVANDRQAVRVPGLEKLLRYYLLAVLLIGLAAFVWWLQHGTVTQAFQVMISIFIVSCPCALGVALPLADDLASAIMERAGVFIREPLLWARLRKVRTIIFDKTGTLTLERPVLTNPEVIKNLSPEAKLSLARLTNGSLHPVSRALLEALGSEGQRLLRDHPEVEVTDVPGTGRHFDSGDAVWSIEKPEQSGPHDAELRRGAEQIACFRFTESLRPDAIAALEMLRQKNHRLVILSGDRPEKVEAAANLLGIPAQDAHASLQPGEKEALVRGLDQHDTLFIGDGANDSLAFNAAWATGTPVVDRSLLESKADFYFLGKGLRFLPLFFQLAHRRRAVVARAFSFALVYNLSVVAVSICGYMNPLLAAILMPLSSAISLGIVASGLRDRAFRKREIDLGTKSSYTSSESTSPAPTRAGNHHVQRSKALRTNPL